MWQWTFQCCWPLVSINGFIILSNMEVPNLNKWHRQVYSQQVRMIKKMCDWEFHCCWPRVRCPWIYRSFHLQRTHRQFLITFYWNPTSVANEDRRTEPSLLTPKSKGLRQNTEMDFARPSNSSTSLLLIRESAKHWYGQLNISAAWKVESDPVDWTTQMGREVSSQQSERKVGDG